MQPPHQRFSAMNKIGRCKLMIVITVTLIIIGIILMIAYYYTIPKEDTIDTKSYRKSHLVKVKNRIDIQKNNECAAFSTAYILRHFGIEADGNNIYKRFTRKLLDGTIAPKGILKYLSRNSFLAYFYKGNTKSLKMQITKNTPVIVLIRVFSSKRYLHYVPVVGYDEEYFYLAESLEFLKNCDEAYFNRKVKVNEFEQLWRTWIPFYKNTYLTVSSH
jgi:ABC-type bacteriocin/lantibiotic exporter with double-glycine peptidase domain